MLLSVITAAFRNFGGMVKTHASLTHLAQVDDVSFGWTVINGGSGGDIREYLENFKDIYNLHFVSEPDNGTYDTTNRGIVVAQGKFALFLNPGDIFHQGVVYFVRKLKVQKDNAMITGGALLDFGNRHKVKHNARPDWYICHSPLANHQTISLPVSGLRR